MRARGALLSVQSLIVPAARTGIGSGFRGERPTTMTLRRFLLVGLLGGGLAAMAAGCGVPKTGMVPVDNNQLAPFEAPEEEELMGGDADDELGDDWGLDDSDEPAPKAKAEAPAPAEAAEGEAPQ